MPLTKSAADGFHTLQHAPFNVVVLVRDGQIPIASAIVERDHLLWDDETGQRSRLDAFPR